jgi:hypothetical protein
MAPAWTLVTCKNSAMDADSFTDATMFLLENQSPSQYVKELLTRHRATAIHKGGYSSVSVVLTISSPHRGDC